MVLANILLALAWAALQGRFSLASLAIGWVVGYLILWLLVKGGVLGPSRYVGRCRTGLFAPSPIPIRE